MTPPVNPIVWIHGDCLNPNSPALKSHPNAPAVWVWDDAYLRRAGLSLKRILFIYESLLELPVEVFRGDVVSELTAFAKAHNNQTVVTMDSPSPGFARICRQLETRNINVWIYDVEPFVALPQEVDLRRFSRYWRVAKKLV